jgi:Co/Zn/Cd efflux system component
MAHIRASRHFQRWANLLNSAGLLAISAVLVWQALERVFHPQPLIGWLAGAAGVFGVLGNWAVALLLRISTVHELRGSGGVLLWPQDATCPHPEGASH